MKKLNVDRGEPISIPVPEPLVAHYLSGTGTRLVVSLAGVGRNRGQVPPMEFIGTSRGGGVNHVLFVSDTSRSWMNGPGLAEMHSKLVEDTRVSHGITEIVALGNSMGGFVALVLANMVHIDTVIAFAPQFSMHPDLVPEEKRWSIFSSNITCWTIPDVGTLDQEASEYYIFHGSNPLESRHWLRFPWNRRLNHFIFDGLGHDVAARIQKRRLLPSIFDAAVAGRPRAVRLALERSFLGRQFHVSRREVFQDNNPKLTLGRMGAPLVVPAFDGKD